MNRGVELKAVLVLFALMLTAGTAQAGFNPKVVEYKSYQLQPGKDGAKLDHYTAKDVFRRGDTVHLIASFVNGPSTAISWTSEIKDAKGTLKDSGYGSLWDLGVGLNVDPHSWSGEAGEYIGYAHAALNTSDIPSNKFSIVAVQMTVPTRIPPRVNTAIPIKIQPTGITVTFEVQGTGGGNGNAVFAGGNNTLAADGSLNLTTPNPPPAASDPSQTTPGHAGNLVVVARIGTTELARSSGFTVAAWPVNYHQTAGNAAAGAVLHFEYAWDSDSGNLADLDQVQVGEHVRYPAAGFPNPPFVGWNLQNPTVINVPGTDGTAADDHGNLAMTAGPARNVDGTQNYRFHCNRTMAAGDANDLAWGTVLLGPIAIQRWVEFDDPSGTWQYRILKSGVTATRPVP